MASSRANFIFHQNTVHSSKLDDVKNWWVKWNHLTDGVQTECRQLHCLTTFCSTMHITCHSSGSHPVGCGPNVGPRSYSKWAAGLFQRQRQGKHLRRLICQPFVVIHKMGGHLPAVTDFKILSLSVRSSWTLQSRGTKNINDHYQAGARGGAVRSGTAIQAGRSRVRYPMTSLEFFIDLILPAVGWCWGRLSL